MPIPPYIQRMHDLLGTDILLMMPAATALIFDEQARILLQRRSDNGLWGVVGGSLDPGEHPADAMVREAYEETGLRVVPERVTGVYGGLENIISYPNGDRTAYIAVAFKARVVGGQLDPQDDESLELRYFDVDDLPQSLPARHRVRIQHALERQTPYFATPQPGIPTTDDDYAQRMRGCVSPDELLMFCGAVAIIRDEQGRILLGLREDGRGWGLPGGVSDPGEHPAETAIRETYEETGLIVTPRRLTGVYGGPGFHLPGAAYTGIFFACDVVGGALKADGNETLQLAYFAPDALPDTLMPNHHAPILHALADEPQAWFHPATR